MKNLLTKMFLTFGSVCLFGANLHAQTYSLTANVPFSFEANGAQMSPGNYLVSQPMNSQVQRMQNRGDKCSAFIASSSHEVNNGSPRLVFHRYGNRYFLAEVWNNQGTGTKLTPRRSERELRDAANTTVASTVSVQLMASK